MCVQGQIFVCLLGGLGVEFQVSRSVTRNRVTSYAEVCVFPWNNGKSELPRLLEKMYSVKYDQVEVTKKKKRRSRGKEGLQLRKVPTNSAEPRSSIPTNLVYRIMYYLYLTILVPGILLSIFMSEAFIGSTCSQRLLPLRFQLLAACTTEYDVHQTGLEYLIYTIPAFPPGTTRIKTLNTFNTFQDSCLCGIVQSIYNHCFGIAGIKS